MGNVATNLLHEGERNICSPVLAKKGLPSSLEFTETNTAEVYHVKDVHVERKTNKLDCIKTKQLLSVENASQNSKEVEDLVHERAESSHTSSTMDEHEHSIGSHHLEPPSGSRSKSASSSSSLANSWTLEMGLDPALQEKWFLTFEQFVSGLNKEPDLCQFFAEQNLLDLSGASSVDPILNSYTRTVLATSPL